VPPAGLPGARHVGLPTPPPPDTTAAFKSPTASPKPAPYDTAWSKPVDGTIRAIGLTGTAVILGGGGSPLSARVLATGEPAWTSDVAFAGTFEV
jgi:hypothetical protein